MNLAFLKIQDLEAVKSDLPTCRRVDDIGNVCGDILWLESLFGTLIGIAVTRPCSQPCIPCSRHYELKFGDY